MRCLEDNGYYCVDNIPPVLLPTFYELCEKTADERLKKMAIVTDVRSGEVFADLFSALDQMKSDKKQYKILFLDAQDDVLLHRYKQTRRKHPLLEVTKGSIEEALHLERRLLNHVKARADYVIDTSLLSQQQLRERISSLFLGNAALGMTVTCLSFGFKYGIELSNTTGIIDKDYYNNPSNEGHIFIKMSNNDKTFKKNITVFNGDAVCQGIFLPFGITVDDHATQDRVGGIGSTNKQ